MQPSIHLPRPPGWITEFQAFILRGNVMELAIGIIIGAAFTPIMNRPATLMQLEATLIEIHDLLKTFKA